MINARPKPVALIVLDGWGLAPASAANAIELANTPNWDRINAEYPHATLVASGEAVGLPEGQMGNSEVGHLNLGAGRVVYQDLTRINKDIREGFFFQNAALTGAVQHALENDGTLHLMGLVSDGGVHSQLTHVFALLELAKRQGLGRVALHAFLDGRDVPPRSACGYLSRLEEKAQELGVGFVATVSGRYYAMDRDNRWERVQLAYDALVHGKGRESSTAEEAVSSSYDAGVNDEFVEPTIITTSKERLDTIGGSSRIRTQDSVIFFNFRPDRTRQLSRALVMPDFESFDRGPEPPSPYFVTITEYDPRIPVAGLAYPPQELKNVLSEVLSKQGFKHLHIAETEKYAHVTYFFNGGYELPYPGEERVLIPSPKVATYDLQPEMSAPEVCDKVVEYIRTQAVDFLILNFANPDMVGHTGIVPAAVKAIETVDSCLGHIISALEKVGGEALIVSDHGNAEKMVDLASHKPLTAHTPNPVPIVYLTQRNKGVRIRDGATLADIAPSLLQMMGLSAPPEMTGTPVF